jgi:hypothetical protein
MDEITAQALQASQFANAAPLLTWVMGVVLIAILLLAISSVWMQVARGTERDKRLEALERQGQHIERVLSRWEGIQVPERLHALEQERNRLFQIIPVMNTRLESFSDELKGIREQIRGAQQETVAAVIHALRQEREG